MRATTQRKALLETLGRVKSAVPSRATLPVCTSVLIRAGGGMVTITGNDLGMCLTGSCKATLSKQGAVCAMPKELEAFLKAVTADQVTLSLAGKKALKVEAGSATSTLEGYEAKDFPPVPGVKGKAVEFTNLGKALKEVSYARAKDDLRPVLEGVCFAPVAHGVELAAADGFRLALTTAKSKGSLVSQVIVPGKEVDLIQRLMLGKVSVHQGPETISFVDEGMVLTVRPIEGTFPNYKQIIPKNGSPLTVDCKQLRNALKVVTVIKTAKNLVRLQTKGKALIVSVQDDEKGKSEARVPAKGKAKIGFDADYLKDLLTRLDGQFTLRTTSPQSPGVVKQNGTTHVLMPMAVQW